MKSPRRNISRVASLKAPSSRSNSGTPCMLKKNPHTTASSNNRRSEVREGWVGCICSLMAALALARAGHYRRSRRESKHTVLSYADFTLIVHAEKEIVHVSGRTLQPSRHRHWQRRQHIPKLRGACANFSGSARVVSEMRAGVAVPIGFVTDRDLVIEVLAEEIGPNDLRVGDIMSRELLTVRESDGIWDTHAMHAQQRPRRTRGHRRSGRPARALRRGIGAIVQAGGARAGPRDQDAALTSCAMERKCIRNVRRGRACHPKS